ncbi:hypothetical protein [Soonwooa sp.]|uniref:hypothetical protein n=1 Tax=Soonwooa sp. TaxID=1938592 RepID=UPI0028A039A3|nr:hypothetical protein [Soonwooa sp.]
MAIWQYTFYIIEGRSLRDLSPNEIFVEDNLFNEEPYWIYSHKKRNLFFEIESILRKNVSWSDSIDLYGKEDSNCLEVFFDHENYITSASIRIDFIHSYESVLKQFIEFCISKDLIMIDEDLNVVLLNYEYIDNIIKRSNQRKVYYNLGS